MTVPSLGTVADLVSSRLSRRTLNRYRLLAGSGVYRCAMVAAGKKYVATFRVVNVDHCLASTARRTCLSSMSGALRAVFEAPRQGVKVCLAESPGEATARLRSIFESVDVGRPF